MLRVPGIGTMCLACASSEASASCAEETPSSRANLSCSRASAIIRLRPSPWNRGTLARQSSGGRSDALWMRLASTPRLSPSPLERGPPPPQVAGRKAGRLGVALAQHPPPERPLRTEADAELGGE